jgi:addiction module HigA family antidote
MSNKLPKDGMRPVHPGEMLREEFLIPLGLSANKLAQAIGVPTNRVTAILNETRGLTADTALRLGKFFDMSPEFWMNLQKSFELRSAEQAPNAAAVLKGITTMRFVIGKKLKGARLRNKAQGASRSEKKSRRRR